MTDGRYIWNFAYDANGMRISRNAGSTTYTYIYDGTQLTWMTDGLDLLHFTYDAAGRPLTMEYHPVEHSGSGCGHYCGIYYYVTNLQGDVIAILDSAGNLEAEYTYDAWGNLIDNPDDTFGFIGHVNPLRYRGYLYDRQTGLYYLQSRYYNPEIGRFISADNYPSTGQGLTGNNMFAYCGNNPVSRNDEGGEWWNVVIGAVVGAVVGAASTYISAKLSGEEVNPNEVLVSALCGAVSGALAATGFGGVAGQMITGAATSLIDSGYQNYNDYKGGEKSFGEALTCTLIDTGMGALFGAKGTDVPDATKALKTSNQIAASYHQAKKILKTTVLHPKTRAAANAVIKAGKKYFWKTAGSTFVESALDATVSVGFSKISELYVKAIG